MSKKNIFNLADLSDVPEQIKNSLKIVSNNTIEKKLIELFREVDRKLSLDEITVAYYRRFKETKNRSQIHNALYRISKSDSPTIIPVKEVRGIYKLATLEEK